MVKEVQIVIGPEDVTKFGLQCANCNATVMLCSKDQWAFPSACPVCNVSWRGEESDPHRQFLEALRSVFNPGRSPVTVRMVFDGEDA